MLIGEYLLMGLLRGQKFGKERGARHLAAEVDVDFGRQLRDIRVLAEPQATRGSMTRFLSIRIPRNHFSPPNDLISKPGLLRVSPVEQGDLIVEAVDARDRVETQLFKRRGEIPIPARGDCLSPYRARTSGQVLSGL